MSIGVSSQRIIALLTATVWLLGVSFFNVSLGDGVYLSQFMLIATVGWAVLIRAVTGKRLLGIVTVVAALLLLDSVSLLLSDVPPVRFAQESIKIAITAVGAWALVSLRDLTRHLMLLFPLVIVGVVSFTYLFVDWDLYDSSLSRFMVPQWGSPNSTAFVVGAALIVHTGTRWWGDAVPRWVRPLTRLAWAAIALVLLAALLGTYSRGGALATVAGFFGRYKRGVVSSVFFWGLLLLAYYLLQGTGIERANLIAELGTTGGTGRLEIWTSLMRDWSQNPLSILIGKGPGSVDLWRYGRSVNSAHSGVVTLVYFYGLVGLGLIVWLAWRIKRRLATIKPGHESVAVAVAWFLLGAGIVDYYFGVAQLLWVGALLIASVWAAEQEDESWGYEPADPALA